LRKNRRHYDALVLKSLSNAFLARMHANRESWYRAFRHGRVAFNILQNTVQIYPEISADAAFGFGLYSYFTAYIKDEYSLVKAVSWMLPAGDRALGLERLQEAAENGVFVKPEAAYFLGHINLHYEKAPDRAETYLTELQENHPRNSFFNRLLLRTYFQQNRQAEATRLNEELLQRYEARAETLSTEQASSSLTEQARRNAVLATLEELYTIRGQLFYQEFNYDEAILAFQEVLSLQPQLTGGAARRHQRIAAYKLGRSYVRQSNKEAAIPYFEALANADSDDGLRELAEAELRRIKE
ncbi:MAG: tetratricopeptide repeat protein, partial [Cyclonatronaceae bacterium]